MYEIFSGVLAQRITRVGIDLSTRLAIYQKGFLPVVHGIQEHTTALLQMAVEDSNFSKENLNITWLDLKNAFRSLPHATLLQLFDSIPFPNSLNRILRDIYSNNIMILIVSGSQVEIVPNPEVRQGDALSAILFNLASEPIVSAAKSGINKGYNLIGVTVKTTAYANDIAIISMNPSNTQDI